jgi:hypothetical protein
MIPPPPNMWPASLARPSARNGFIPSPCPPWAVKVLRITWNKLGVEPMDTSGYPSLHSDLFNFSDAALAVRMRMFMELVLNWTPQ